MSGSFRGARSLRSWRALGLGLALSLMAGCGGEAPQGPVELADTACRPVTLVDAVDGHAVTGAEDLAVDPASGLVFISAFDRFSLEDALKADQRFLPRGGLYVVPFQDLVYRGGDRDRVEVRDILTPLLGEREIRPHGIDLYTGPLGQRVLGAVVHRYERTGLGESERWERITGIETFTITDAGIEHSASIAHTSLCQANDLAIVGPRRLLVTRDRGTCGPDTWMEDVLGLKRARVIFVEVTEQGGLDRAPVPVADRIAFANGIAIDRERRRLVVAATRDRTLLVYDLDTILSGAGGTPVGKVVLPGGPDNLTMAGPDRVIAAVHPSLLDIGLYRNRWLDRTSAPSRIVSVDMRDASQSVVFDDADGSRYPAATVGLQYKDHMLLGSVGADGLLICHRPTGGDS